MERKSPIHPRWARELLSTGPDKSGPYNMKRKEGHMELHQLRYFLAVADSGSFTKAAKASHVSQPSLSIQLAKLEAELGGPLFERARKGARLTQRGERFLASAKGALNILEAGKRELDEFRGLSGGRITLGCLPTTGAHLLPQLLKALAKQRPDLQIDLREESSPSLRRLLLAGEVDLAILDEAGLHDKFESSLLFREPLLAVFPPKAKIGPGPFKLKEAGQWPWVMLKRGHGFRQLVEELLAAAGPSTEPRVVFESDGIETVQALVEAGQGMSLVPKMVLRPGLTARPLSPAASRGLYLAKRPNAKLNAAIELVAQTARKVLA